MGARAGGLAADAISAVLGVAGLSLLVPSFHMPVAYTAAGVPVRSDGGLRASQQSNL